MSDYIEREKLLKLYVDGKYDSADYHVPVPVIIQNIKDIPAADVRPVVRGKWEWEDDGEDMHYYCSCCHHNAYGCTCEILDGKYNFCPNCGADMREES